LSGLNKMAASEVYIIGLYTHKILGMVGV
jgi:hypothetical protein